MTSLAPTSRLTYLERPQTHPGQCAQCGSATRPVIDTGLTIKWHGAIYFCVTCVEEMGRAVNMVPRALLKESEQAEQNVVNQYLKSRDLVTVDGRTYRDLTRVRNIVGNIIDSNSDHFVQDDRIEQQESGISGQLLFDLTDFTPKGSKQSSDIIVSEGSNVLSDGGDGIFNLE